jgi:uncharacterized protein (TIGR02266 family)
VPFRIETLAEPWPRPRFLGYAGDVSETGAFVQCTQPRPVGTHLRLRLQVPGLGDEGVGCEAEVVWVRPYGGRQKPSPGMGVRFLALTPATRGALGRFAAESDPESAPRLP